VFSCPNRSQCLAPGPGLGHAVAQRYAQGGYDVVLVARRRQALELLAQGLTGPGVTAHAITGDLADIDAIPALAAKVRAKVGDLAALYFAPTPEAGFVPAADLTPQSARAFMPLVPSTPRLRPQKRPGQAKTGGPPSTPLISPTCCGTCITQKERQKPSTPCRGPRPEPGSACWPCRQTATNFLAGVTSERSGVLRTTALGGAACS
jgi:hypothetical protein